MKNDALIEVFAVLYKKGQRINSSLYEDFFWRRDEEETTKLISKEETITDELTEYGLKKVVPQLHSGGDEWEFIEDSIGFRFFIIGQGNGHYSSGMDFECQEIGFEDALKDWFEDFEKIAIKFLELRKKKEITFDYLEELKLDDLSEVRFITLWGYDTSKSYDGEYDSEYDLKGVFDLASLKLESVEIFLKE